MSRFAGFAGGMGVVLGSGCWEPLGGMERERGVQVVRLAEGLGLVEDFFRERSGDFWRFLDRLLLDVEACRGVLSAVGEGGLEWGGAENVLGLVRPWSWPGRGYLWGGRSPVREAESRALGLRRFLSGKWVWPDGHARTVLHGLLRDWAFCMAGRDLLGAAYWGAAVMGHCVQRMELALSSGGRRGLRKPLLALMGSCLAFEGMECRRFRGRYEGLREELRGGVRVFADFGAELGGGGVPASGMRAADLGWECVRPGMEWLGVVGVPAGWSHPGRGDGSPERGELVVYPGWREGMPLPLVWSESGELRSLVWGDEALRLFCLGEEGFLQYGEDRTLPGLLDRMERDLACVSLRSFFQRFPSFARLSVKYKQALLRLSGEEKVIDSVRERSRKVVAEAPAELAILGEGVREELVRWEAHLSACRAAAGVGEMPVWVGKEGL